MDNTETSNEDGFSTDAMWKDVRTTHAVGQTVIYDELRQDTMEESLHRNHNIDEK